MKFTSVLLLIAAICLAAGCEPARPSHVVLVFVDVSESVRDVAGYRDSWSKIVNALKPGDRVILAAISDRTYTGFRPALDYEIPRFNFWRDNKLAHENLIAAMHSSVFSAFEGPLRAPRSRKTDIFGAFLAAETVFKGERRQGVLVLLSDMLEDCDEYNFERQNLAGSFGRDLIAKASRDGRLPDLGSVKVYVAGASAGTAAKATEIEKFWLAYVKAANGDLSRERYGPALMNFGE